MIARLTMNRTALYELPDDVLCCIFVILDASELFAIERTCIRIHRLLSCIGWRLWLQSKRWDFGSCPIPDFRALTWPTALHSRTDESNRVAYYAKVTTGPSYLANIGTNSEQLWRERKPTSYLVDQHEQASGPVVRTDGAFIAWTVRDHVKWTCSIDQWPVKSLQNPHLLKAHTGDLTDLLLVEEGMQQATITVAGVDGKIACWRIGDDMHTLSSDSTNNVDTRSHHLQLENDHDALGSNSQHASLCWQMSVAGQGVQRIQQRHTIPHRLISASQDLGLRVVDTYHQTILAELTLPTRPWALQWLSDDAIAVGLFGHPGSLAIYRLRPDAIQFDTFLLGHHASVYGLDTCPLAPKLLLSGGYDGQTRLWDLRLASSTAHTSCDNVTFDSSIASSSYCCVGLFEDELEDSSVYSCKWDGQRIVSGRAQHGVVKFWDARWHTVATRMPTISTDGCQSLPRQNLDAWTHYNGRLWSPVYSLCLEQTRVLVALETELWWLDFTGNTLVMPVQTYTYQSKKQKDRRPLHHRHHHRHRR